MGNLSTTEGFQTISFIDGMTSDGVLRPAGVFTGGPEAWQSATEYRITALDSSTDINIELLSQDELNAIFTGKTFTEDVTIVGAPCTVPSYKCRRIPEKRNL